jgi:hypothetical protein
VLSKLREWTDTAEAGDTNKIAAARLLGQSVGLFREVVETTHSRSSDDLLADLEAMLDQVADDVSEAGDAPTLDDDDGSDPATMH